jgi:hypothetical protein
VLLGPFVDITDGVSPETGLTTGAADDVIAIKHDPVATSDISSLVFTAATNADGWYTIQLTPSETDTEGQLTIIFRDDSETLPVFATFQVIDELVYDSLYSTASLDNLQVDTIQVSGTSQTANDNGADINAILTDTEILTDSAQLGTLVFTSESGEGIQTDLDTLTAGVNVTDIAGAAVNTGTAQLGVNTVNIGGTSQTGNDVGADVDAILTDTVILTDSEQLGTLVFTSESGEGIQTDLDTLTAGVNVTEISGDSTSADNLELQYDTTGLTGGTFPSTQDQVGAISTAPGGTLLFTTVSDNVAPPGAPIKGIPFSGIQTSGTFASTEADDGTYHIIDDQADDIIDIVYWVDIGGNRTASEAIFTGYVSSNNDVITVQAYDFVGSDWETRATIPGQAGTTNIIKIITLLGKHTGTSGDDVGLVFIRFVCAGQSNPTLNTDSLLIGAVSLAQSVGYANGAIWVDTNNGTAGTESFVNGTADNPVLTWANALTISGNTGLATFEFIAGSAITLTGNSDNYHFRGQGYTVVLDGQSISGAFFGGATLSGNDDGSNGTTVHFHDGMFGDNTLGKFHAVRMQLSGDLTLAEAGTYLLDSSYSGVAGTATPSIDMENANESKNLNMRHYSGGIEIKNFGHGTADHNMSLEGWGQLIIDATSSNADAGDEIAIRGSFMITDEVAPWGGTIADNARYDTTQILEAVVDDSTQIDASQLNTHTAITPATAANVNAQVLDVMNVDTFAEPGQGNPPGAPTMREMMHYNYKYGRNKKETDATTFKVYNDAGAVVDQKSTRSDDGSDYTQGEMETGP